MDNKLNVDSIMVPQKIQALFDFIDYLDNNKSEYIEKYIPLCDELKKLDSQRKELNPSGNYKDKQNYDKIQIEIKEKFSPITSNVFVPISNKLLELGIWSGDDTYASIWNNNFSEVSDFKTNFTSASINQVMHYKQIYLSFRAEVNSDFLCLSFVFQSLDEILKVLFDFFKDTNENEFAGFETKTISVSSIKKAVKGLIENKGQNVQFTIPTEVLYKKETKTKNAKIKNKIIMGDNIKVRDVSNNTAPVSIGKGNITKIGSNDELAQKSYNWQKWGIITGTIIGVIAIVVTIVLSLK